MYVQLRQDESGQPKYKSILVENIDDLLSTMVSGRLGDWYLDSKKVRLDMGDVTSHLLREYVLQGNNHPAKD